MTTAMEAPMHIGKVTLVVHDLDRVSDFYQQALGLHRLHADGGVVQLGSGGAVLLELRRDTAARRHSRRDAGLFHTAFLLPTRAELGRWMKHAAETRLPLQGASDHLVSEALYLADPEGNGIEIYADRPVSAWKRVDGMVEMPSDPLDIANLMAAAGEERWKSVPDGALVGHVHLQVGAIAPAEEFYAGLLGFDVTCRYQGGSFYGSGGYHHHLASNVWNSRGAPARSEPTTGLADVELLVAREILTGLAKKLSRGDAQTLALRDPWGTGITVRAAE
jgi:catechol 2,3-dioxygenase